jgi:hypothetical protein
LPWANGTVESLPTSLLTSPVTPGTVKPTPCRPSSAHTGAFEERICFDRLESSETACSGLEVEP